MHINTHEGEVSSGIIPPPKLPPKAESQCVNIWYGRLSFAATENGFSIGRSGVYKVCKEMGRYDKYSDALGFKCGGTLSNLVIVVS